MMMVTEKQILMILIAAQGKKSLSLDEAMEDIGDMAEWYGCIVTYTLVCDPLEADKQNPPEPPQDPGLDPNLPGANNLQELCEDGIDNDKDGSVDENACFSAPAQRIETQCSDALDNDNDGATDRQDADCIGKPIPPLDEEQPSQLGDLQVNTWSRPVERHNTLR